MGLVNCKPSTTSYSTTSNDASNSNTQRTTIAKSLGTSAHATCAATEAAKALENYKNRCYHTLSSCDSEGPCKITYNLTVTLTFIYIY